MGEDQPGGAVAHCKHPAGEDDPLGPGQRADVLKLFNKDSEQETEMFSLFFYSADSYCSGNIMTQVN